MNRAAEGVLRAVDVIICIALGAVVVWLGYARFYREVNSALLILALVAGGILGSLVCTAFHELGHVLAGLCCNFRLNNVSVGFLSLRREDGRVCLRLRRTGDSLAGSTEMLPRSSENLYGRFLFTVAGGLLFSFLFLAGTVLAVVFYSRLHFAAFALICTAMPFAFHLFFYNALPFNDDNLDTDGGRIKGLLQKDASYLTAVNILAVEGYMWQGCSPSEIDPALYFDLPQLPEDDLNFILLTSYRFMYFLDADDFANAEKYGRRLEDLLEYAPYLYRMELTADALFCACYVSMDEERARELYEKCAGYLKGENSVQSNRVAAAYEWRINKNRSAALRALSGAESRADACEIKGLVKYERKLISALRAEIVPEEN